MASSLSKAAAGFGDLTLQKQVGLLVGLALSIALGIYVALWSQKSELVPLYANLDPAETAKVIEVFQKHNIHYQYDNTGHGVLVDPAELSQIRMKLAVLGIPKKATAGFERLESKSGLGTSQFVEILKYRVALENELSQTLTSLEGVKNARVHLGLAKTSSFIKKNTISTGSVMVEVQPGYSLNKSMVAGISHLVSSSVPGLKQQDVSVVDQYGRLLSTQSHDPISANSDQQYSRVRQMEELYVKRIEEILSPILGHANVKSQVTVDADFTFIEKTDENFDNQNKALKSEAVIDERKGSKESIGGIPGALSNQPPALGEAPEDLAEPELDEDGNPIVAEESINKRQQATRNYEVSKSIVHTRHMNESIKHVSAAVVVNDKITYSARAQEVRRPLTEEEISQIEQLVKDAIGYNQERGDRVTVVSTSFAKPPPLLEPEPIPLYAEKWFMPAVKQAAAALFLLILLFGFLKPLMRGLVEKTDKRLRDLEEELEIQRQLELAKQKSLLNDMGDEDQEDKRKLEKVARIAQDDSKKVAQVVMNWVGSEDE